MEWISVKKRLPVRNVKAFSEEKEDKWLNSIMQSKRVLISINQIKNDKVIARCIEIGCFDSEGILSIWEGDYCEFITDDLVVTHWMPLPKMSINY